MLGWRSWAQARLSRRNRSRSSGGAVVRRLHHLDGDFVAEVQPAGPVDVAHPAGAERADDFVAVVDPRSRRQHYT